MSSVIYTFWLVLTNDLLEDKRIDDVIIKTFFNSLLYKTNRFQVTVHLFSNRSQRTSKCGKNISATFLFLHLSFFKSSLLIPTGIYYWTDARQLGIYLLNRVKLCVVCSKLTTDYQPHINICTIQYQTYLPVRSDQVFEQPF